MDSGMERHFILKGKKVQPASLMEWARYFETADRHVGLTKCFFGEISTVFLGLNHNCGTGPPLIFETMVFGGPLDEDMDRYATYGEAEKGHIKWVRKVRLLIFRPKTWAWLIRHLTRTDGEGER